MNYLPKISVIVCTRDRPNDLEELLSTILKQSYPPSEVIILDDSPASSAKQIAQSFSSKFQLIRCQLKYAKSTGDGLPAARNLGIKLFKGDAILFIDDDVLLDQNILNTLATFLRDSHNAIGVQPKILPIKEEISNRMLAKLENAIYKALMLNYHEENKLKVRRSGASILPNSLTKAITVQRLSGCCCCYKREVFHEFCFDTNLKRWGFMEDLDFSYRLYKKYSQSLYAVPSTKIIHKASKEARLPNRAIIYMTTIYWFYVFFKDIFESSVLNLIAFLWALTGNAVACVGGLIIKRKPKLEWWNLIYLLASYSTALRNLKNIVTLKLEFFNKNLSK